MAARCTTVVFAAMALAVMAAVALSAVEPEEAGAAVAHIHVRDPESGVPSMKFEHYREVVERIKDSGIDAILNITTGPGARYAPPPDSLPRGACGAGYDPSVENRWMTTYRASAFHASQA